MRAGFVVAFALISLTSFTALAASAEASVVRGTVRDKVGSPGRPVANAPVYFWQQGGGWARTVTSGPDGYFECDVPSNASYNLACNKPDQPGARGDLLESDADNVAVGDDDLVVNFDLDAAAGSGPAPAPAAVPPPPPPAASGSIVGLDDQDSPRGPVLAAFAANGGARVVGTPYDNGGGDRVHAWGGVWIQDFRGGAGGTGALLYRDGEARAHWVHGDAWAAYLGTGGAPGSLGAPVGDEANGRQEFEQGALVLRAGQWTVEGSQASGLARVGLDGNQIFGGDGTLHLDADLVAATGTKVLRVNFARGAWSGPADDTRHQGRTWREAADTVVDTLTSRGIQVYGLLNDELTGGGDFLRDMRDPRAARAWVERFAAACEVVVARLRDRVRVFEIVNEPNDWSGGSSARVSPYWEALILERVYERVKLEHAGDPSFQVTLVSGPLLSWDGNWGQDYLEQVYENGKRAHDWDAVRARCGSYPLDGIGFHLYHLEDPGDAPASVAGRFASVLDAYGNVVGSEDPEADAKKFYVSEFGWQSDSGGEGHQADMVEAGFDALLGDSRVALAVEFCLGDWPGASWGLVSGGHRKEVFERFRGIAGR